MMQRVDLVTAITSEPISLEQAKTHLRVTNSYDDDYIKSLVTAVREEFEDLTGTAVVQQDLKMTLDSFSPLNMAWWDGVVEGALSSFQEGKMAIARPPLIEVTEIASYDLQNVRHVFDPANYFVDNSDKRQAGRVVLNIGCLWPVNVRSLAAVEVLFTAGYATVPQKIIQVLLKCISWQYEHRGDVDAESFEKAGVMGAVRQYIFRKPAVGRERDSRLLNNRNAW